MLPTPYRLADGTLVLIRRIRPDDRPALAVGLRRLSEATRHKRFLGPKPRFTRRELTYLTEVDFVDHYALVAVLAHSPSDVVASARWVRERDDPATAEVAVVVADNLHGKGLGRRMGEMLAAAARERGIERFTATMLADNVAAHRLFTHIASSLESHRDGTGTRAVVAQLAA